VLLAEAQVAFPGLDSLAIQLTGALEGPMLLYLATSEAPTAAPPGARPDRLADGWQALIERLVSRDQSQRRAYGSNGRPSRAAKTRSGSR
jgi:hypothetical protein